MSILSLGKVSLRTAQKEEPDYYVALPLSTCLGTTEPKLISSVTELESIFGTEFSQYKLCYELLNNNIPILVMSVNGFTSVRNYQALQIYGDYYHQGTLYSISDKFGDSYPFYNFCNPEEYNILFEVLLANSWYEELLKYSTDTISEISADTVNRILKNEVTYLSYLYTPEGFDISESLSALGDYDYLIYPSSYSSSEERWLLTLQALNTNVLTTDYYDRVSESSEILSSDEIAYSGYSSIAFDYSEVLSIISAYILAFQADYEELEAEFISEGFTIPQIIESLSIFREKVLSTLSLQYLIFPSELLVLMERISLIDCYDSDNPTSIRYVDSTETVGLSTVSFSYDTESEQYIAVSGTDYSEYVTILDKLIEACESFNVDRITASPNYGSQIRLIPTSYSLVFNNQSYSAKSDKEFSLRVVHLAAERYLNCVFYRKYKGNNQYPFYIKVSTYSTNDYCYEINITNSEVSETYYVCTDVGVELEDLGGEYIRLQEINELSDLVTVVVPDYVLYSSSYTGISQSTNFSSIGRIYRVEKESIEPEDFITYDDGNLSEVSEIVFSEGQVQAFRLLPEDLETYTFRLWDNGYREEDSWYSRQVFLRALQSYGYHPDFIVDDSLLCLSSSYNTYIADTYWRFLKQVCTDLYTQTLVSIPRDICEMEIDSSNDLYYPLIANINFDSTNTALAFVDTITIDNDEVPSYYPFLYNMVYSRYLNIIDSDSLISSITSQDDEFFLELTDDLRQYFIQNNFNFLDYNNLEYFYTNIRQEYVSPGFIIQYCIRRLSRCFLEDKSLVSCESKNLTKKINAVIAKFTKYISLHSELNVNYEVSNHDLNITCELTFPEIINKTYIMNIVITY